MTRTLLRAFAAALIAASVIGAASGAYASAQSPSSPGEGPIDASADRWEVFDREGRIVYEGDVNILRGGARLRADRVELFFARREGGGFGALQRMEADGDVFYVTEAEIARGARGVYDLVAETITLEGDVVLTQGCNVSTGERLVADVTGGAARLTGGPASNGRVRSVFFDDPQGEQGAVPAPGDCPAPEIPGDGPEPFVPGVPD
ncbi:MAG: LptA/OstA family protein [Oceanicaulis sp.]